MILCEMAASLPWSWRDVETRLTGKGLAIFLETIMLSIALVRSEKLCNSAEARFERAHTGERCADVISSSQRFTKHSGSVPRGSAEGIL